MPVVYFGVGSDPDRVTIGAAVDVAQQLAEDRRADPAFHFARILECKAAFACVRYLHQLYASRRLVSRDQKSWFAIDLDEADHAIHLWRLREQEYEDQLRRVERLKKVKASGTVLAAAEDDVQRGAKLKQLQAQISALQFEKECLELELKLRIGSHAGLHNIARWTSVEAMRFDTNEFKITYPELYEEFRRPSVVRYFKLS